MSGFLAIEGIFFAQESAKSLSRQASDFYQLQSGVNNLAIALRFLFILKTGECMQMLQFIGNYSYIGFSKI